MVEKEKIMFMNTLGRKVEEFKPITPGKVKLYTCGPTVYARAHIGNLRAYVFADVLRRTLEYAGYDVNHVMNITDVGHLTSDADSGEDKMQKAAKESGSTSLQIAEKWTQLFFQDIDKLNIERAKRICKATEHIPEQIELVKTLEKKGFTYQTSDGIYFDTSKFQDYANLARLDIAGLSAGKRISIGEKRNKTDFALWKFSKEDVKRDLEWDSPWGRGFPGWHIECSAMCIKYLGETIDIHTGGVDHIPVHHTNEIAQSECATGKKFVNYWLHSEFLLMDSKEKMSKSLGNLVNLDTLTSQGIEPLAYRYLCLNAHYRKQLLYGREILKSAETTYSKLRNKIRKLDQTGVPKKDSEDLTEKALKYRKEFRAAIFNDLNTPQGLAIMWNLLKDEDINAQEKYSLAWDFDKVLALGISQMAATSSLIQEIPARIEELRKQRDEFRKNKHWNESDRIRGQLAKEGYVILDTIKGSKIEKQKSKKQWGTTP